MRNTQVRPGQRSDDTSLSPEARYLRPLLAQLPVGSRTAIEAGAGLGAMSGVLAEIGLQTLTLEANAAVADQLQAKLATPIRAGLVKLIRCTASDRDGAVELVGGSPVHLAGSARKRGGVRVPTRRLDWLAAAHGRGVGAPLGLLRIGVASGADLLPALRGFFDAGRLAAPAVVMFEASEGFPPDAPQCLAYLGEQGYTTFDLVVAHDRVGHLEIERLREPQLPATWRSDVQQCRAGVIAYNPSVVDDADLPDPTTFSSRPPRRTPEAA